MQKTAGVLTPIIQSILELRFERCQRSAPAWLELPSLGVR